MNIKKSDVMRISKWGNGLGVRLPAVFVQALQLKAGDEVEIRVAAPKQFEVSAKPGISELLARLRKFRDRLPAGFRFDRDQQSRDA
jgi:antitoxin MazE